MHMCVVWPVTAAQAEQGVRVNINKEPCGLRDGVDTRKQVLTQQVLTRPSVGVNTVLTRKKCTVCQYRPTVFF